MFGVLVEDDEYKAEQIISFLNSKDITIALERAFVPGIKKIMSEDMDFILLDMSIPTYESDFENPTSRNRKFGGRDILCEMKRIGKNVKTIVVTQYSVFGDDEITLDEMNDELMQSFPDIYKGLVFYNASALDWQERLYRMIME